HLFQDTAMVLGHQVSGVLGIAPRPTGSLAEQFLHAEATNLQIGAGMALVHRMTPGFQGLERGLDISLSSNPSLSRERGRGEGGITQGLGRALAMAGSSSLRPEEETKSPDRMFMSDTDDRDPRARETPLRVDP